MSPPIEPHSPAKPRIARIVHVTDQHLFVDEDGNQRSEEDYNGLLKLTHRALRRIGLPADAADVIPGLGKHNDKALKAFNSTIFSLIERDPQLQHIIVQSGDFSAFGADANSQGGFAFHELAYGRKRDVLQISDLPVKMIDVYGNHDLWPGSVDGLIINPELARRVREAIWAEQEFQEAMPSSRPVVIEHGDLEYPFTLEFLPVDTNPTGPLEQFFAQGKVVAKFKAGEDRYESRGGVDAREELLKLAEESWERENHLRIAVSHHPPHYFSPSRPGEPSRTRLWDLIKDLMRNEFEEKTVGEFHRRDEFAKALGDGRIPLVLSGHLHRLDPIPRESLPLPDRPAQSPLRRETIQLVADSPTQLHRERASFAYYDIEFDEKSQTIDIGRTVLLYTTHSTRFVPARSSGARLVKDLPLNSP